MGKFSPDFTDYIAPENRHPSGEAIDRFATAWDFQKYKDNSDSYNRLTIDVLQPYIDEVEKVTGRKFFNPGLHYYHGTKIPGIDGKVVSPLGGEVELYGSLYDEHPASFDNRSPEELYAESLNEMMRWIADTKEQFAQDSMVHQLTPMKIEQQIYQKVKDLESRYQYNEARTFDYSDALVDLAGTMGGAMNDPINIAASVAPFAFGPALEMTVLSRLGSGLVLNVGSEAMIQSDVEQVYKKLGLEYTDEQYWANVFAAAGGSILLGGFIETLLKTPQIAIGVKRKLIGGLNEYNMNRQPGQTLFDYEFTGRDQFGNEILLNPENNIKRTMDSAAFAQDLNNITLKQNPYKTDPNSVKFINKLDEIKAKDSQNQFDEIEFEAQMKKFSVTHHEENDANIMQLKPEEIEFQADVFQFKSGGDKKGLLGTLKGVKVWNPVFSGEVIVYQTKDGKYIIADGHQRLGLAKELSADKNYTGPKPILQARVFKEIDGFTPEYIRVLAGAKNISNQSGTAIDAARLWKVAPRMLDELVPPDSVLRQYGKNLMSLDDSVLMAIKASNVPERYAQYIGKYFVDKKEQLAVLNLLAKATPQNLIEAENIVANAKMAGFKKADQQGLFSDDVIAESLFKERATILSTSLKGINTNKKLLNVLVEKSNSIEQYGNKLNKLNNSQKRDLYGQIIETIKHNANNAGGIADDLTEVTQKYARKELSLNDAAREFERAVERRIASGSYTRLSPSRSRTAESVAAPFNPVAKRHSIDDLESLQKYHDGAEAKQYDEEILALQQQVKDKFDELEANTYTNIKQEKLFEVESIDGNTKQLMSFDDMSEEIDFADAAIKELKDC